MASSEVLNYGNLSDNAILEIFENAILKKVKRKYQNKIRNGKPLKSNYIVIESDPEPYTRRVIEPIINKFLPYIDFNSEVHKKTSLGNLKKPDGFIVSKNENINKNLLIEWEPFNEDLRIKKDHGVNQAKTWISDINIGQNNDALVTNGRDWIFVTTQRIKDEIRVIENDLSIKQAFKLMEDIYNTEKICKYDFEESIDITDKFYNWYVALIYGGEYLSKDNKKKVISKEDCLINNIKFSSNKQEKENFIRLNFTRLIFIRILNEYGIIKDDILNYLNKSEPEDFHNRVNQLFFETLNTPLTVRENVPKFYETIPFLNGDLFRKKPIDTKGLIIRRNSFVKAMEFLRTFNFTKEFEDTKNNYRIDNTINPEILGHILEKTIENRKESGVYYTPQIITEYMSEDIIRNYLLKEIKKFLKEKDDIRWKYIEKFEDIYDFDNIILKKIYHKYIKNIKICDPAVGSGAFLLSCGNTLFDIRTNIFEKIEIKENDYTIKKEIIQDNLYGVDIKEPAVDICKLRLWLWIIEKQEPEPLPNIDFNIRKGNSLIGYTNADTIKIDVKDISTWEKKANLMEIFLERNNMINDYYKNGNVRVQQRLKERIDEITVDFNNKLNESLINDLGREKIKADSNKLSSLTVFHWIMEFSEVFENNNGFDIIIGNPPYYRITFASKFEQKIIGKLGILKDYHHGQGDIYYDFIVRSYEILREGGHFIFITSRYWLESAYANYLKKFIKNKVKLTKIIDFREQLIFKGVDIHNTILSYLKEKPEKTNRYFDANFFDEKIVGRIKSKNLKDHLEMVGSYNLNDWKINENWAFVTKEYKDLFMKIKKIKTHLGDDYKCNQYTNCFRKKHKPLLIFNEKPNNIPDKFLRKYRKMGEIKKFTVSSSVDKFVLVIHDEKKAMDDLALSRYLSSNKILKGEIFEIKDVSDKNIDKYNEVIYIGYRVPRLIYNFIYEDENTWVDNTYFITQKKSTSFSLMYLTGILNSELMRYYIDVVGKKKDFEIEIGSTFIHNLPVILKRASLSNKEIKIVNEIEKNSSSIVNFERKNRKIDVLIEDLNNLIYDLYKINENERILIKAYLSETYNKLYQTT